MANPRRIGLRSAPKALFALKLWPAASWRTLPTRNWATPRSIRCWMPCGIIRAIPLPSDAILGQSTLNVGTIRWRTRAQCRGRRSASGNHVSVGGRCRSVAGRHDSRCCRALCRSARSVLHCPAVHLTPLDGLPTTVVAFTTDIPTFKRRLGPAVSPRARQHSCRAHRRRAHREKGIARCRGHLCADGPATSRHRSRRLMSIPLAIVGYGKMGSLVEQLAPEYGFDVRARS